MVTIAAVESQAGRSRQRRLAVGLIAAAAFISFVISVSLWFTGRELEGIFVGLWVPSILTAGIFSLLAIGPSR